MKRKVLSFVVFIFCIATIKAATITSNAGSNAWGNTSSWVGGHIPGSGDDVVVNGTMLINVTHVIIGNLTINGTITFHSTLSDSLSVKNLTVNAGGLLNAYGAAIGKSVIVKGNFTNNGSVEFSYGTSTTVPDNWSTLKMGPATSATSISGTGNFSVFRQLIIDNPMGVTLNRQIVVSAGLNLKHGTFTNNGTNLKLDRLSNGPNAGQATYFYITRSPVSSLVDSVALGTSNQTAITYLGFPGTSKSITEGIEIPPSRIIHTLIVDNSGGVVISNDLTLQSNAKALAMYNGILSLASGKTIKITTTAALDGIINGGSPTSYVQTGGIELNASASKVNRVLPLGSDSVNRAVTLTGLTGTGKVRYVIAPGPSGSADSLILNNKRSLKVIPSAGATQTFDQIGIKVNPDDTISGIAPDKLAFCITFNGKFTSIGTRNDTVSLINSHGAHTANGYFALARTGFAPGTRAPLAGNTPLSEIIGVVHDAGKYQFEYPQKDFMQEGADAIAGMNTKLIKLWFGHASQDHYPAYWGCNWNTAVDFTNLTNLAKSAYFSAVFHRTDFKTYILNAYELNYSHPGSLTPYQTNFKDGISPAEKDSLYNEFFRLTSYLYSEFKNTGKTFILSSWEGDGMLNFPAAIKANNGKLDTAKAKITIQGLIDWLNTRQDAITAARIQAISEGKTGVVVVGAAECNAIPRAGNAYNYPLMIDSVIPHTHMDLYSLSDYKTNTYDQAYPTNSVDSFKVVMDYMKQRVPQSDLYGSDNIYLGELGTFEFKLPQLGVIGGSTPESDRITRETIQRNVEQALKYGIRYIAHWEIYDNGLRDTVKIDPNPANATSNQLVGIGIIRADHSYSGIYNYYKSIMGRTLDDYRNVYEAEAQVTTVDTTTSSHADLQLTGASGGYMSKLTASTAGQWINYGLHVSPTGLCNVKVTVRRGSSYGKLQLSIDNVPVDSVKDCYNAANDFYQFDFKNFNFTNSDPSKIYNFKFTVAGKSPSSARYDMGIDAINITPANKVDQIITFNPLPNSMTGSNPFELKATASSGLAVAYASSDTSIAKITGTGNHVFVTVLKQGSVTITASQTGDNTFLPATNVSQTLTITNSPPVFASKIVSSSIIPPPVANDMKSKVSLISYPNPFNGSSTVSFSIPVTEKRVILNVYSLSGTKIQTLFDGPASAGEVYNAIFQSPQSMPTVYFIKLITSYGQTYFKLIKN